VGIWVSNQPHDQVERNVVYTESTNKILDVLDIFLMGLWGEQSFEQPLTIGYLVDLAHLLESRYALLHDHFFLRAIMNFLHGNCSCTSSVDDTLVVTNRVEHAAIIKHTPILLDQSGELCNVLGVR
jgi:hypothetical protein